MVDPAKFIVRARDKFQDAAYAPICAEITQSLIDNQTDIGNANDLVTTIADRLKNIQSPFHPNAEYYGVLQPSPIHSFRDSHFSALHEDELSQIKGELKRSQPIYKRFLPIRELKKHIHHTVIEPGNGTREQPARKRQFDLTATRYKEDPISKKPSAHMHHADVHGFERNDKGKIGVIIIDDVEHRWSQLSQAYSKAMDEQQTPDARKHAALEVYWWLEQDLPVLNGSDTLARIALEYMANHVGFDVPLVKPGNVLGRYAQCRTLDDFVAGWEKQEYFDRSATSESVMEWQRQAIARQYENKSAGR